MFSPGKSRVRFVRRGLGLASVECFGAELGHIASAAAIVFVPVPNAMELAKHSTLPVLYVACQGEPESKNLVTFRLNSDGTIVAKSRRAWDNYFTSDANNPTTHIACFAPRLPPTQHPLSRDIARPGANAFEVFCANQQQRTGRGGAGRIGAAREVDQGVRTDLTNTDQLMNLRYDPVTRRLLLIYWNLFGWSGLDRTACHFTKTKHCCGDQPQH